jgi:alkylglycerol monooxygenase
MEEYGKILTIAMPAFLLLIIIEKFYGLYRGEDSVPLMDAASSISSGITNAVKDVLGLSITFISYEWMVSKIAIFHLEANILSSFGTSN